MRRTLLLLGGIPYLLPVIEEAHELGCSVVTCDFLPNNYAHQFSDGYVNASIIDRKAVLDAAREVRAGGIMSFATDPGVVSAAYAAQELGLSAPGPIRSIEILQDKYRFRTFLEEHGFPCPHGLLITKHDSEEQLSAFMSRVSFPYVVKPTDLSGSKGVGIVWTPKQLADAIARALDVSRAGRCIVEEYVSTTALLETDVIVIDGTVHVPAVFVQSVAADAPNPLVPIATTTSRALTSKYRGRLERELQQLCDLLGLTSGLLNVEARVGNKKQLILMEVSPRAGGGDLALVEHLAEGPNVIRDAIRLALGEPVSQDSYCHADCLEQSAEVWHHENVHSNSDGLFRNFWVDKNLREEALVYKHIWAEQGKPVRALRSASDVFGAIIFRFPNQMVYETYANKPDAFFRVEVS